MSAPLAQLGIWLGASAPGDGGDGELAALLERLGFGSVWLGFSPRLTATRPLLEATERLAVGTSIVNVWDYQPAELAAEWSGLAAEFGDRLTVGIGIGHREVTQAYARPLSTMREFLAGLDAAPMPLPPERRALAALGPKMLDLARERSRGALPYLVTVAHTATARERLGPGPLLVPELACVVEVDAAAARERARRYLRPYLGLANYRASLLRLGFEESDLADGGSERLVDELVPHGDADRVLAAAGEHLDAGADQVALQPLGTRGGASPESWRALAAAGR